MQCSSCDPINLCQVVYYMLLLPAGFSNLIVMVRRCYEQEDLVTVLNPRAITLAQYMENLLWKET